MGSPALGGWEGGGLHAVLHCSEHAPRALNCRFLPAPGPRVPAPRPAPSTPPSAAAQPRRSLAATNSTTTFPPLLPGPAAGKAAGSRPRGLWRLPRRAAGGGPAGGRLRGVCRWACWLGGRAGDVALAARHRGGGQLLPDPSIGMCAQHASAGSLLPWRLQRRRGACCRQQRRSGWRRSLRRYRRACSRWLAASARWPTEAAQQHARCRCSVLRLA